MKRRRLVYITTVPESLVYYHGHVAYMKAKGYAIEAISSPGSLLDEFGKVEVIPVHPVRLARRISPFQDLRSLAELYWTLRRLRPSIVHSTTPKAGFLGTLCAKAVGARAVLSVFGLTQMTMTGAKRWLVDAMTRVSCRLADRVWCDSRSMRDYLVEHRLCAASKTFVAGAGSAAGVDAGARFNPDRFTNASRLARRAACGIPENAFVIGYAGRIAHDKGIHELTRAWLVLRARYSNLHLLLVGALDEADPIRGDDAEVLHGDPRVHFTGRQTDMPAFFAIMNLFVMPSYREGFGMTNIEAAALALPVVSTLIPGCVDSVMDGVTGTLVPPRDAEAIEVAIERYYLDAGLRERHGKAGRSRVIEEFSPHRIWADVAEIYESLS